MRQVFHAVWAALSLSLCLMLAGCAGQQTKAESSVGTEAAPLRLAVRAAKPPVIDGRLDDACWQNEPVSPMLVPVANVKDGLSQPLEPAEVRLAWDDQNLYVGVTLHDRDIVQYDDRDQQLLYESGDVLEIFLKPQRASYYWEMYVAPTGGRTTMLFPSHGRLLPQWVVKNTELMQTAAVQLDGTLNNWHDTDEGWTAEAAIPRQALAELGIPLKPGEPWRMLVARYNYGVQLEDLELSSDPQLPVASYHDRPHWAQLELLTSP